MTDDILLGWTKYPVVQAIFAAGSEENETPPSLPLKGRDGVEFFVDMETITLGYALFVSNCFACALGDGLDMRDDTLSVFYRLAAVVVGTQQDKVCTCLTGQIGANLCLIHFLLEHGDGDEDGG